MPTAKKFNVTVVRIGYGFVEMEIVADSIRVAKKVALELAGGIEFSEKSADYKIENISRRVKHDRRPSECGGCYAPSFQRGS